MNLKNVFSHRNRALLRELVITDFKLRYQGSLLGYLWSLLKPLALFTILYLVFVRFLKFGSDVPFFEIYLLLGIVIWNYFSEVTSQSLNAIVGKGDLLRKINFPKYIIVLSTALSAMINLVFNLVVVGVFMVIAGVPIMPEVIFAPFYLLELFIFSSAVGFFLSALYVKFRDFSHIWEVVMQAAFYFTPILYPLSMIPEKYIKLLMLNPMAQIIQDLRHILVTPKTQTVASVYDNGLFMWAPFILVAIVAICATQYFRSRSRFFAEEV